MLAQSTRPQWRADTYYIPTPEGVYLRGNNNRLILKGKSLYPLLEHLVPHLNGTLTLAEITEGLDADRQRMVMHLIEKLLTHRFVRDASQDQLHTLNPLELDTCAAEIAFIASLQTSAAYRFECFRARRLLLVGSGAGCTALLRASLQAGARNIGVLVASEDEETARACLDLLATSSSQEVARFHDVPDWEDEAALRRTIQAYDAVLHLADRPLLARAHLLNRLCIEEQKALIQALTVGMSAWSGPLVCPETGACWECAWRRLQANVTADQLADYAFRDQPTLSGASSLTASQATLLANRLLFTLFQYWTQTSLSETSGSISALDLATGLSESHAFLPHPHCQASQHPVPRTAPAFLEQIEHLRQQAPVDLPVLLENFAGCVDERSGLFREVENGPFTQFPLAVYKVRMSNPMPGFCADVARSVVAASVDVDDARMRVALQVCAQYAVHLVDQRRLLSGEAARQASCTVLSAEQFQGSSQPLAEDVEQEMWTWALDLQTQKAALVPARCVFAASDESARGLGAGRTWEEALCQALLDWCNFLTVEQLPDAHQAYSLVNLEQASLTPAGTHLSRLLKAAGRQITVYDVTGSLGVPTFAVCAGKEAVAYATHCDAAQALSLGLERVVQHCQAEYFQQPDYALAPVADLPLGLRADRISLPHSTLPNEWPARLVWLVRQLRAAGMRAFAVPLDHDPALAQMLPFVVRVLVSKSEWEKGE